MNSGPPIPGDQAERAVELRVLGLHQVLEHRAPTRVRRGRDLRDEADGFFHGYDMNYSEARMSIG